MPVWSEILRELQPKGNKPPDYDGVRRKYLHALHQHTDREVILYASGWLQKTVAPPDFVSIGEEDIHALMEVTSGLKGPSVDLILHSPGGSLEAAEAIVLYLRSRFSDIRVIVPQLAMSAAAMIACGANRIVMGKHSFMGPTDPQFLLSTQLGNRIVPAQAILDQFDKAVRECSDPAKLSGWLPMLTQFGPDLLVRSEATLELAKDLVKAWLQAYMFNNMHDGPKRAESVARWLTNHKNFKSHSRHIPRSDLMDHGLKIDELEIDETLQDLVLSVFHATTHTLGGTSAVKIVENHLGSAFIKQMAPPPPPPSLMIDMDQMPNPR